MGQAAAAAVVIAACTASSTPHSAGMPLVLMR